MWTSCKMLKSHRKSPVTVWALSQDHVERHDLVMKGVYIHCALNQLSLTVPNEPHGPPLNPNDLHWASLTPTVLLLSTTDTHWPSLTTPISPNEPHNPPLPPPPPPPPPNEPWWPPQYPTEPQRIPLSPTEPRRTQLSHTYP